ncbi:DUF1579 family protein [Gallaecimonas kandeliae]|uniref:DUF1579 family protein n=1 Tax=Gallaecimonas kandeliae TaxID=3029055 RepID=UPI0026492E3A|nr:DUF1579 family protein [Gallaecimonas kandeliae]WKE67226.1 DUF1579 family protein [Gallaecimonas kandeliae]
MHSKVLALSVAAALSAVSASGNPPQSGSSISPATTPQARLAAFAGHWQVRQSLWTAPGKAPQVDKGFATFSEILDGHHLRQDLHIDSAAKPFQGLGFLGYDDASGRYDSLWMDVNFSGVILAHGSYDEAKQTYTFTGSIPLDGHAAPLREVLRVSDANHFVYEYYEQHGGPEMLTVRLEYSRAEL